MAHDALLDPPLALAAHHVAAIEHLRARHAEDPSVLALLLGGSIAHGFAGEFADVDYVCVVDADHLERRRASGRLTEAGRDGCDYPGGYTDGKFVDLDFLAAVAARGSEPARFAYRDVRFVIERDDRVRPLLADVVRYPVDGVDDRIERFAAQLLAWRWFHGEALAKSNRYLELLALQKLTLFSCRIVLAVNRMLYPFHKWMLRVTESAPDRPPSLMDDLDRLVHDPEPGFVDAHVRDLIGFAGHAPDDLNTRWGDHFLLDNELTWMSGCATIDDL